MIPGEEMKIGGGRVIRDGRIVGIGKAGNPDIQRGVDIIICSQKINEALHSGITTMMASSTGPATGTNATTCTPGA